MSSVAKAVKSSSRDARPDRTAIFTDTFDEMNGVAMTLRRLVEYCRTSQINLDVYAPAKKGEPDTVEEDGCIRIIRIGPKWAVTYYQDLYFSTNPGPTVRRFLRRYGPYRTIQLSAPGCLGWTGRLEAIRSKTPIIGVHHTHIPEYAEAMFPPLLKGFGKWLGTLVLKQFYRRHHRVLVTTPMNASALLDSGLAKQVGIFPRGVELDVFNPQKRARTDNRIRVLYAGRVSPEKGLQMLVDAVQKLRAGGLDFDVQIAGSGPMLDRLKEEIPDAEFLGRLPHEELAQVMADADVFVFPSLTDTFGNAVLEAQASGLPCIVCDKSGPGEIIRDGETGLLAQDQEAFESALEDLITSQERRMQMGLAAKIHVKEKTWEAAFQAWRDVHIEAAEAAVQSSISPLIT